MPAWAITQVPSSVVHASEDDHTVVPANSSMVGSVVSHVGQSPPAVVGEVQKEHFAGRPHLSVRAHPKGVEAACV